MVYSETFSRDANMIQLFRFRFYESSLAQDLLMKDLCQLTRVASFTHRGGLAIDSDAWKAAA